MTDPSVSKAKCLGFGNNLFRASTRLVCPVPMFISCLFFTSTIPFDLRCFTTSSANNRSSVCAASGLASITSFSADDAVGWLFLSMASTPCSRLRNCSAGKSNSSAQDDPVLFLPARMVSASAAYDGAMMTSKNNSWIMAAVAASTSLLAISTRRMLIPDQLPALSAMLQTSYRQSATRRHWYV